MSRILVAEDDPHILRVVSLWLTRQGHDVCAVRNGRAALEHVRQERPDILITDVNMPGMNGLELTRTVLNEPDCPRGIVLLTNRWDHRELGDQVARSIVHVMPKPFSPSQLAQLVEELAGGKGAPPDAPDAPVVSDAPRPTGIASQEPGRP